MNVQTTIFTTSSFHIVRDGHPAALALYKRHYSSNKNDHRKRLVGPGSRLLLLSHCNRALIVWRKFIDDCIDERTGQKQQGINCAVFRNENKQLLSSALILESEALVQLHWPEEARLYTYVDESEIKSSNPGCCFKKAGWKTCGRTKTKGLLVLEKFQPGQINTSSVTLQISHDRKAEVPC